MVLYQKLIFPNGLQRMISKRRNFHSTTSTLNSSNNQDTDPLTNGGTVVGVWIFHRHGDRAPNRYLGSPQYIQNEAEHWYSRIPHKNGEAHANLSQYFTPDIHSSQNNGKFLDVGREPFGFLTYRGMDQMREVGRKFRQRYERFGHCKQNKGTFLDNWNVQAYSTNYLRTVMSVQCFLDGLIGKPPNDGVRTNSSNSPGSCQIHAGGGLKQYYKDIGRQEKWMLGGIWTTAEDIPIDNEIKVLVRDKKDDTLNAFDRQPQMMNGLVKDVIATEEFQKIDGDAKSLADHLSEYLPGLRGAPQAFGITPSAVNWVHANDHFVCRKAHAIPLATNFAEQNTEDEEKVEAILKYMSPRVCAHLAWRFRAWYKNEKLLSAVACPPFRDILNDMRAATAYNSYPYERKPFAIYSCHDVTLLAFLYGIGADFLVSQEDREVMPEEGGKYARMVDGAVRKRRRRLTWRWWPAYSSTIAFELVRLDDGQHRIRVILNGEALRLIPRMNIDDEALLSEQPLESRHIFGARGPDNKSKLMTLSDFEQLIHVLEKVGGTMSEEDNSNRAGSAIGADRINYG